MKRQTSILLGVIVLAVFTLTAGAQSTWYVSPSGDDGTGDGSEGNPWRTIQYGVDMSSGGDTVMIMDDDNASTDDYTENVIVDKNLIIERYDDTGANPQVAAASATHIFHITANNVTIR